MKTIGIILREWTSGYREIPLYAVRRDVIIYLNKYDVNLVTISLIFDNNESFNKAKNIINICDGIILPGGSDPLPLDNELVKYLYDNDIPTLGICLGMQIMSLAFNDNKLGRLGTEDHNVPSGYVHKIKLDKESMLYNIIGEEIIEVNSRHHDYIEDTRLDKVAYSIPDNILEAVEDKTRKFFVGVQWHPESLKEDVYSKKIFDAFISKL